MGTLRFFEEVVSFKIRRTFGFADYICPEIWPIDFFRIFIRRSLKITGGFSARTNRYRKNLIKR